VAVTVVAVVMVAVMVVVAVVTTVVAVATTVEAQRAEVQTAAAAAAKTRRFAHPQSGGVESYIASTEGGGCASLPSVVFCKILEPAG